MKVLQLTSHFRPNIGGVETHLDDLCKALVKRGFEISVLTYRPLHTNLAWEFYEKDKGFDIIRIPWFPHFFYRMANLPFLEFLFLCPGLFFVMPWVLIWKQPNVIHAHGLVAAFVGVFWGKLFRKKIIVSTHSIYHFPKKGLYKILAFWVLNSANYCLGLSIQSKEEIKSLGISSRRVGNFIYWVDLNKFKRIANARKLLSWKKKFIVLFVGRLVEGKGIIQLLEAAKIWQKGIELVIIGSGPMEKNIKKAQLVVKSIKYEGLIDQSRLPLYYSGSNLLIIPSDSDEGFGRVILESLACGTPVIGSDRGAISEAINESVGRLIKVNPKNIKNSIEDFYNHRYNLRRMAKNCRAYAERRYSEKNVETIIKTYSK